MSEPQKPEKKHHRHPRIDEAREYAFAPVSATVTYMLPDDPVALVTIGARLSYRVIVAMKHRGLDCTCELPDDVWLWNVEQLAPLLREMAEATIADRLPPEATNPESAPKFWHAMVLRLEDFFARMQVTALKTRDEVLAGRVLTVMEAALQAEGGTWEDVQP